jgi:hypothetical protein
MVVGDVFIQSSVSFGRQLVFFLFLLIPGYVTVRAYYWSNIALEDSSRVNRLVLMAIGGFASLAFVSLWRKLLHSVGVSAVGIVPDWLVIRETLSVQTVATLTVLQSTNLILSQVALGTVAGVFYGTFKYVLYDKRRRNHTDREQPWGRVIDEIEEGGTIEIVTSGGERVSGKLESIGSQSENYDILLADPTRGSWKPDRDANEANRLGELSYHHYEDISQVIYHGERSLGSRTWLQRRHTSLVQSLTNATESADDWFRNRSESDDRADEEREYDLPLSGIGPDEPSTSRSQNDQE